MSNRMYQRNLRMRFVLAQAILWFHLSILGLEATSQEAPSVSFETWKQECNCSCLNETSAVGRLKVQNCVQKEIFEIDNEDNILKSKPLHLGLFKLAVGNPMCSTTTDAEKDFNLWLVTLNCVTSERGLGGRRKRKRFYTILQQRNPGKLLQKRTSYKFSLYAASSNEKEEITDKKSAPSTNLIAGLSVGLALVIGVVASLLCIRHGRKPTFEDKKNEQNNDIDEEEDSHPYCIVDLSTQIAYDSAGYTFLAASKKEEENPYQKLNVCGTRDTKNIASEKKENIDLADADEPIYFVLEA